MLDQHCEDLGRDPTSIQRSVFLFTAVADSPADITAMGEDLHDKLGDSAERFMAAGTDAGLIGPADKVAAALDDHVALGFDQLHLLFPYGHEIEQIERYATEVFA